MVLVPLSAESSAAMLLSLVAAVYILVVPWPLVAAAAVPAEQPHAVALALDFESSVGRSLLQTNCGETGQPCCPGSDNRQWCRAGNTAGFRRCSSDTGRGTCQSCGGLGEPCCRPTGTFRDGPPCARGGACTASGCVACGRAGEPCCDADDVPGGRTCAVGSCSGGRCAGGENSCGENGQPCCPGRDALDFCSRVTLFFGVRLRCSSDSGAGTCITCGRAGEPCCRNLRRGDSFCDPGNTCSASGQCVPCGELGEACCAGNDNDDFCGGGRTLSCSDRGGDGVCVTCGGFGEPCCQRFATSTPFCANGECNTSRGCCGTSSCDSGPISINPPPPVLPPARPSPVDPPVRPPPSPPFRRPVARPPAEPPVRRPVAPPPGRPRPRAPTPRPVPAPTPAPQGGGSGVAISAPDRAVGSAGFAAIGIHLGASAALSEADFITARDQVVDFIDRSSAVNSAGVANSNVYYVTSNSGFFFNVTSTNAAFLTNTGRRVSRLVTQKLTYRRERFANLIIALGDLALRFENLSRTASSSAFAVVIGGTASSTADFASAALRLRSSYAASEVSISAIAVTAGTNITALNSIASRSVTGQRLVFQTSVLSRVSSLLTTSVSTAGGVAIAIALDTSAAVSESEFLTARSQLISFIDSSSEVNTAAGVNRNIYYLNAFSSSVRGSTGVFLSNTDRQVSRLVEQQLVYRRGSIDLVAGLTDLRAQFSGLSVSIPALALVVAAGTSSRLNALAAADLLRSSYASGVSVGCVALGGAANVAALEVIASTGVSGESLSFRTSAFSSIAASCTSALGSIDVDGDGTVDTADACFSDAAKVEAGRCGCGVAETPDCGDVPRCRGGLYIGIAVDSSSSVGAANFALVKEQIITFIDATSGADTTAGANSNRYYVNSFTTDVPVLESIVAFTLNVDRLAAKRVDANIRFRNGGTDIAAGIDDLTAQFAALPGTSAGLAIVITDGQSSRAEATAAANRLRAEGVTVAAVAIGDGVDRPTLEAVASTGSDGEELVFETDLFDDIAGLLATLLGRLDTDGDGTDDCLDGCPTDPNKRAPLACGCGQPETC